LRSVSPVLAVARSRVALAVEELVEQWEERLTLAVLAGDVKADWGVPGPLGV
jgi:hypothetical protein